MIEFVEDEPEHPETKTPEPPPMTDVEALTVGREAIGRELADLIEGQRQPGRFCYGYDPRRRIAFLQRAADALDRMLRERHEAYQ